MSKLIKSSKDYKFYEPRSSEELKNLPFFGVSSRSVLTSPTNIHSRCSFNDIVSRIKSTPPPFYHNIGKYTRKKLECKGLPLFEQVEKDYKDKIRRLKTKLLYYTLSGFQHKGRSNKSIDYNGCIQIDIDIKSANGEELAHKVKECFKNHSYISLCGISPSKHGVKALVFTNNSIKENHYAVFEYVKSLLLEDCSLLKEISEEEHIPINSLIDALPIAQPCFVFYDKDVYATSDIKVLNVDRINDEYNAKQKIPRDNVSVLIAKASSEVYEDMHEVRALEKQENRPNQKTDIGERFSGLEDSPVIINGVERKDWIGKELSIRATKLAKKIIDKYKEGEHRSVKVFSYASKCNEYGVSLDIAREQALSFDDWNLEDVHIEKIRECYERYYLQFGTNKFKLYDVVELPKAEQVIKQGGRLSDVFDEIDFSKNAIIVGPTNSGKTWCIMNMVKHPRILLVPDTGLLKDVASEYSDKKPSLFYQDAKAIHNDNLIVCTYHSFKRLCQRINLEDYIVYVDEAHNFSASVSYLAKELTEVIDLLPMARGYFLFTATPLISMHPTISSLGIINIEQESPTPRYVKYLVYDKSRDRAVVEQVKKNKLKGIQTMILFNNKNEKFGQLSSLLIALNSYKVAVVNADKKEGEDYRRVVEEGNILGFDVVLCTTVLKEGNSITKHNKEVQYLVIGAFHPADIEQFSGRCRLVKYRSVLILRSAKSVDIESSFLAYSKAKEINKREEITLGSYNLVLNSEYHTIEMKDNYVDVWSKLQHNCIDISRGSDTCSYDAKINQLKISGELLSGEISCANSDSLFMLSYLKERFHWNVDLPSRDDVYVYTSGEMDKKTKDFIMARNKANKEKEEAYAELIFSDIVEQGGAGYNSGWLAQFDTKKSYKRTEEAQEQKRKDKIEYKIRNRLDIINQRINNFDTALDIMIELGSDDRKYRRYFDRLRVDVLKKQIKKEGTKNKPPLLAIEYISGSAKVGDKLSGEDLLKIMNNSQDIVDLPRFSINDAKVVQKFGYFFKIKRCKIPPQGDGDKRTNGYEIVNTNPSGLDLGEGNNSGTLNSKDTREVVSKLYGIDDKDTLDVLMQFPD